MASKKREQRKKYAKNKKLPVNLRLLRSDLRLIDAIAQQYGRSRAWILANLLEADIKRMFDEIGLLNEVDQAHLALHVDSKISEGGLEHDYEGKTWELAAARITDEIGNTGSDSIWHRKQRKKDGS